MGFLAVAALATAVQVGGESDKIGICHATGDPENPYVLIVTARNGYEHGHHRHHPHNYFLDDWSIGCGVDVVPPTPEAGEEYPVDDGDETDAGEAVEDETSAGSPGNETADEAGDEAQEEAGDGNQTAEDSGEVGQEEAGDGNETADDGNGTAEADPAPVRDVAVKQTAFQDDFEVVLTVVVRSVGDGNATDVVLMNSLPDLRRTWFVGGADASDCVLAGQDLSCWFGALAPGEVRQLELRAYTDRMPCGFPVTNTVYVDSFEDAEERNNSSSASISARAC